jgi:NAD+ kinase
MTQRLGLVVRAGNEKAVALAKELLAWCQERNLEVDVDAQAAKSLKLGTPGLSHREIVERADPIVTLGGDGTLIGAARFVKGKSPLFVGVNFGNLGFLTEVRPTELFPVLENALHNKVPCAERVLLFVQVVRDGNVIFESQAVNDAVVQKGARSPLPELDLSVNEHDVARIRADGIIIATPTGSTAYSLAAGGSIAHPALDIFLVTPVCPHSLTNRPLILPGSSTVGVKLPHFKDDAWVTIDGQVSQQLQSGDFVRITQAKQTVRFVISPDKSYFDILRTKLNWGVPNKAD